MGANNKLQATYHGGEYTPDTEQVRASFANSGIHRQRPAMKAGFDRWLETVRAEAKAEALMEAAHAIASAEINLDVFEGQEYLKELWAHSNQTRVGIVTSLRARANQYKENQS